jgi:hypothetical protein
MRWTDTAAEGETGQIERKHGAERERRGFHTDLHDAEPEDLEGESDHAAEPIERRCPAHGDAIPRRPAGGTRKEVPGGGNGAADLGLAPRARPQPGQGDGQVGGGGDDERAADPEKPYEDPRSGQRSQTGPRDVEAVQQADDAAGRLRRADRRAHEKRQRHAHEGRRHEEGEEVQQAGPPQARVQGRPVFVEHVVIQPAAGRPEHSDAALHGGERDEGRARGEPRAEGAAGQAAQSQSGQESGHDDGDGVGADATMQGEHALPGDLVDEGGRAAQHEGEAEKGGRPVAER